MYVFVHQKHTFIYVFVGQLSLGQILHSRILILHLKVTTKFCHLLILMFFLL